MIDDRYRLEEDSMGSVRIPADALYGPQTQRAVVNFDISDRRLPHSFLRSLVIIKIAAAETNRDLGLLSEKQAEAIIASAEMLLENTYWEHFPVSVYQTGSGTSTNMNVNEVICSLARRLGVEVSANDHVNLGQSSNDVVPSALHLAAALEIRDVLRPALAQLSRIIRDKGAEYRDVVKTGRTHLMDALPLRLQAEMGGWAAQIDDCRARLDTALEHLSELALGGTAVGSGVNCHPDFPAGAIIRINARTGLSCKISASYYKSLSSLDTVVEVSGILRTTAISIMKIANDLRWMNSGPLSGLGEISLPALQPGSSIMPAKVNPVIPEAVCMAAAQVIGNDAVVAVAGQSGNFQLNTMLPVAAANLLESVDLLAGAARSLGEKAIAGMTVNREVCSGSVARNPVLVTALNPVVGYLAAARIAKKAIAEDRPILDIALEETGLTRAELLELLDPARLADGGRK
ncbi:MAG: class II fumarate hydratase [Desulfocapsaceae bacterium]|nr:class II fumarate hydratase [Desulfocapsaceae bacterium]